jgi:cAMP-specific phosphodiesterase
MGLNNSFHLKCDTPMGILSSVAGTTSVLEVHHCNLAIQVLAQEECNVFHCLNKTQAKTAYQTMVNAVLATDMANHGKLVGAFKDKIAEKAGNSNEKDEKDLLLKMFIKTADLSNTVKPFDIARMWAVNVTEEFFHQGDLEKIEGHDVMAMFDREKSGELAKGQLGFIDFCAGKHMELMSSYTEHLQWLYENVTKNRALWQDTLDQHQNAPKS